MLLHPRVGSFLVLWLLSVLNNVKLRATFNRSSVSAKVQGGMVLHTRADHPTFLPGKTQVCK